MARHVLFAMALLPLLFALAHSQDTQTCSVLQSTLSSCLTYLTGSSTATPDQSTCCTPLAKALNTPADLQCICALKSSASLYQKALGLPKACKLSINVSDSNCTSSTPAGSTPSKSSPSNTNSNLAASVGASFSAALSACLLWSSVALLL